MSAILIVGALLQDITFLVDNWPVRDKVVYVEDFSTKITSPGGKALNTAVAVARLGGKSIVMGCIGQDALGDEIINVLTREHVDTTFVSRNPIGNTGVVGIIIQTDMRENPGYISAPGASLTLTEEVIEHSAANITKDTIVIVNYEIPQPLISKVLSIAKSKGATTILNPAPMKVLPHDLNYWHLIDYIIPNLDEAKNIIKENLTSTKDLARAFFRLGVKGVCITLGADGCYFETQTEQISAPKYDVSVIDAVGASDAFCAAFALGLVERMNMNQVLNFATGAAGIACTKAGGMPSMPYREEVNKLVNTRKEVRG